MLLRRLEREMVAVVNAAGVDVNAAAAHTHRNGLLQFVCGLGPRRARHLLQFVKQQPGCMLRSREELTAGETLPATVYRNAAGFLRIAARGAVPEGRFEEEQFDRPEVNPLDGTRIHPDMYGDTVRLCRGILQAQQQDTAAMAKAMQVFHVLSPSILAYRVRALVCLCVWALGLSCVWFLRSS